MLGMPLVASPSFLTGLTKDSHCGHCSNNGFPKEGLSAVVNLILSCFFVNVKVKNNCSYELSGLETRVSIMIALFLLHCCILRSYSDS